MVCASGCAGMLFAQEPSAVVSAELTGPDIVVSAPSEDEALKEVDRIMQQALKLIEETAQTLKLIKDKATADAHAAKIKELLDGFMALEPQAEELAEQSGLDDEVLEAAAGKYMEKGEALLGAMMKEMERISDAEFYGSEALKKVAEGSDFFPSEPLPPPPPVVIPQTEEEEE